MSWLAARSSDGITFAGLLNALDGLAAQRSRVVVLTTNAERRALPQVLLRPGRVDRVVYLGRPSVEKVVDLYAKAFGEDEVECFGRWLQEDGQVLSMAEVHTAFVEAEGDPRAVRSRMAEVLRRRAGEERRLPGESTA